MLFVAIFTHCYFVKTREVMDRFKFFFKKFGETKYPLYLCKQKILYPTYMNILMAISDEKEKIDDCGNCSFDFDCWWYVGLL
jgi:hypothetical protein